jgi:hypothetical protein
LGHCRISLRVDRRLAVVMLSVLVCGIPAAVRGQQRGAVQAQDLPDAPGFSSSSLMSSSAVAGDPAGPAAPATIEGTVVDPNGDVIQGARVVLSGPGEADPRVVESGGNGQFTFSGLPTGSFRLSVSWPGMDGGISSTITVQAGETRFLPKLVLPLSAGVTEVKVNANQREIEEEEAEEDVHIEESQRVLGVVPNFYSVYEWNAPPLNGRQKFQLAFRSEIDPITFLGAGAIAGGEESRRIYPGYGSEVGGFGKRFAAQYVNDFDSRMIGSAVLPSLFHQDPRYFYKGTGTIRSRAWYAIRSAFICRGDNGRDEFDISHIGGDFVAGALSNLYYPEANEGTSLIFTNGLIEMGGMAGTNLIREFLLRPFTTHVRSAAPLNP